MTTSPIDGNLFSSISELTRALACNRAITSYHCYYINLHLFNGSNKDSLFLSLLYWRKSSFTGGVFINTEMEFIGKWHEFPHLVKSSEGRSE